MDDYGTPEYHERQARYAALNHAMTWAPELDADAVIVYAEKFFVFLNDEV